MKALQKYFLYIVVLILIAIILFQRECGSSGNTGDTINIGGKNYVVIKKHVDTVYYDVKQTVYHKGETIYKEVPIYVDVPSTVDTAEILKNYYSVNVYKDTLQLDSNLGYIAVTDTISQNAISGRLWKTDVKYKTVRETTIVAEPPKNQYFIGVGGGVIQPAAVFVGPSFALKTKKDHLYTLNTGISSQLGGYVQASIYWKLNLKLPLWLNKNR